jgi:cation:H+ antiporter
VIAVWIAGVVGGLAVAVVASRYALGAATDLARIAGLSPFLIGVTVVGVGTDLPEIANSISASATGHGDINVGDSIGSVVTQSTLVLGLLCFLGTLKGDSRVVVMTGSFIVATLAIGTALVADDNLTRSDGIVLIICWGLGMLVIGRQSMVGGVPTVTDPGVARRVAVVVFSLLLVGGGAFVAVQSFSRTAEEFGLPEYLTSFFVLSLGTSLPELIVAGGALRRGATSLALGDILGSTFTDATLSLGIGPTLFPIELDDSAVRGGITATVVLAVVVAILARQDTHAKYTGAALLFLYAVVVVSLL